MRSSINDFLVSIWRIYPHNWISKWVFLLEEILSFVLLLLRCKHVGLSAG